MFRRQKVHETMVVPLQVQETLFLVNENVWRTVSPAFKSIKLEWVAGLGGTAPRKTVSARRE